MSTVQQPVEWSIKAQNLPEHARNPIHTDAGAQAAGFPRALVAGVTTYAYMTHPLIVAWGEDWLARGGGEIRFRRPVFDLAFMASKLVVSVSKQISFCNSKYSTSSRTAASPLILW